MLALGYGGQQHEAQLEAAATAHLAAHSASPSAAAFAQFVQGEVAALDGSLTAEAHLRSSIEHAESVGNSFIAGLARVTLATVASRRANTATALSEYLSVITTWQRTGAWTSQWVTLRNSPCSAKSGAGQDAAVLYGAAVHATTGAPAYGRDRTLLDDVRVHLEGELEPHELQKLINQGSRLRDHEVVEFALDAASRACVFATPHPGTQPARPAALTHTTGAAKMSHPARRARSTSRRSACPHQLTGRHAAPFSPRSGATADPANATHPPDPRDSPRVPLTRRGALPSTSCPISMLSQPIPS